MLSQSTPTFTAMRGTQKTSRTQKLSICINKLYTVTGLNLQDGQVMYQDSYPVYIQINSTEAIQTHQALGFDKLIPQKTQTIDEFIEVIDISEDPYSEFEYTNRLLDPENFINQRYKVDDYGLAIGPIIYWVKESWLILIVYTAILFALFTYITKSNDF